jgi:hypothetical protein
LNILWKWLVLGGWRNLGCFAPTWRSRPDEIYQIFYLLVAQCSHCYNLCTWFGALIVFPRKMRSSVDELHSSWRFSHPIFEILFLKMRHSKA